MSQALSNVFKLKDIINVKDPAFGAKGDGVTDDTAAIQAAIDFLLARGGGTLLFPFGIYIVTSTLTIGSSNQGIGLTLLGDGNASGSTPFGAIIKYTGTTNPDTPVIYARINLQCSIEKLDIDANSKAGYCLHVDAPTVSATANKGWTFHKVGFTRPTRAQVVLGQATFSGGDFVAATNDADMHMNVFDQCNFTPIASTKWGIVVNVANNSYQQKLKDSSFEGTPAQNAGMINFVRVIKGNSIIIDNVYFPPIPTDVAAAATASCVRQGNGSVFWYGGGTEEARLLYKDSIATAMNQTTLHHIDVNDPSNNADTSKKISINGLSGARLTMIGVDGASAGFSRRVITAGPTFAINCDFGNAASWEGCAPFGEFITPNFSAGDFTASGAMTWTVEAGDVVTYAYTIAGRMMTVLFHIRQTTIGGTPSNALFIKIPGGFSALRRTRNLCEVFNNNVSTTGYCEVAAAGTTIDVRKDLTAVTNYTAETNATEMYGQIAFAINV